MFDLHLPLLTPDSELRPTVLISTVCALSGLIAAAYRYGVVSERKRRASQRLAFELTDLRAEVQSGFAGLEMRLRAVENTIALLFESSH